MISVPLLPNETAAGPGMEQTIERLDYKDADLRDIVRLLATRYDLNIFVDNAIDKRITLHLAKVKVRDALNFIAKENDLILQQTGNIYKIHPPPPPPEKPTIWQISVDEELFFGGV